jgi:hypothetical protein
MGSIAADRHRTNCLTSADRPPDTLCLSRREGQPILAAAAFSKAAFDRLLSPFL